MTIRSKKVPPIVPFIILFILFTMVISGCGNKSVEETETIDKQGNTHDSREVISLHAESVHEIGLELAKVERQKLAGQITVPATLIPNQDFEAQVGSLIPGRVQKVLANVGNPVREGEVLMFIEGLEIGEIKSSYISAKAKLEFADQTLTRQRTLLEQEIGSQKALQEAQSEYQMAKAEFDAQDKKIHSIGLSDNDITGVSSTALTTDSVKNQLDHTSGVLPIKAPISGVIVERNVVSGQFVDASTNAFRILNTSTLWADGQLYEKDLSDISNVSEVQVTVTAFPGERFQGRIIFVSPIINQKTRTITVRAIIPNKSGKLKPHMYGEFHIPFTRSDQLCLALPESALMKEGSGGRASAFIALSDTSFEKRQIILGRTIGSITEILDGVKEGERVVTKGVFHLKSELLKETFGEEAD